MTWLECVCGHSLAGARDFAYSSHFFAAADWQDAGEQILEAMARLLAADTVAMADGDGGSGDDRDGTSADDEDAEIGAIYACEHCGRHWLRLPDGHRA